LVRVGLDDVRGYLKGGMTAWIEAGLEQAHVPQVSVEELRSCEHPDFVLDVTSDGEWKSGHISGAKHIMLGNLSKHLNELPRDKVVHVICGSGYRSSIASSILANAGFGRIINVLGGMTAWKLRDFPTVFDS
ncbi:MAG: rhodanese-like domain-containing protein, partial [Acidobacteriota bacterium]|nr:rhodanese-like domain-containing protein [Acidobacteriota bacterium]